jgi:hypothetical protein
VAPGTDEPQTASTPATQMGDAPGKRPRFVRWSYRWVWVVIAVGVFVTSGLGLLSAQLASSNESHLLTLRGKEVGAALTSALPDIETPLGATAALANITGANRAKLDAFASSYVGSPKARFVSLSVWRISRLDQGPVVVLGSPPELPRVKGGAVPVLRAAVHRSGRQNLLTVLGLLNATPRRLAYMYAGSSPGRYIVEAEAPLPPSGYTRLPANSAYSDLDIAVYMGRTAMQSTLLISTVRHLPLPGSHSITVVPFGSNVLTVVISARQPLGGALPQDVPWMIAIIGVLLTVGAAALTFRLVWGGRRTQSLAAENRRLYGEQHDIAQSLQHALLPDALPTIEGLRLAGIYDAGAPGIEIGGDWYDMLRLSSRRLLLVVGDVSGRGIRAATAMASVRSAIQYAAQVDPPEDFLPTLSELRSLREHGLLATVVCVLIDLHEQSVQVTSAGHLPPILVHDGRAEYLESEVGLPIGVDADCAYASTSYPIPDGACLFAFTDGLVERHGESLDVGLERLRVAAAQAEGELETMMAQLIEQVRGADSVDDTAIAGVQWTNQNSL